MSREGEQTRTKNGLKYAREVKEEETKAAGGGAEMLRGIARRQGHKERLLQSEEDTCFLFLGQMNTDKDKERVGVVGGRNEGNSTVQRSTT